MSTASTICQQLHPAEWDAPVPRSTPCADCARVAMVLMLGTLLATPSPSESDLELIRQEATR